MGAWGHLAFENDIACDWAAELVDLPEKKRLKKLEKTLSSASNEDFDELEEVLAAAETVAALGGAPGYQLATPDAYTEDLASWIRSTKVDVSQLLPKASAAVKAVLDGSDLADRWAGSGDDAEWRAATEDLLKRLEGRS